MLVLVRDAYTETAVLGRLFLGGTCICYTLENRLKAIPCGTYNIENSKSPKFKRELPLIYGYKVAESRSQVWSPMPGTREREAGCRRVLASLYCDGPSELPHRRSSSSAPRRDSTEPRPRGCSVLGEPPQALPSF